MSKDMKHSVDVNELNSLSRKHVHRCVSLLIIPSYILYSFCTPSKPNNRLHRVIFDYHINIKLDRITNDEYMYLSFSHYKTPFRPESLILSNERITCLMERYFMYPCAILSMPSNLRCLK